MAKAKVKAKVGRPSKFDSVDLKDVEKLALKGWSDEEMSDFFGVNIATWTRWKQKHEEFRTALKNWKIEADSRVERSLYERARGYSHPEEKIFCQNGEIVRAETVKHYPPDTTACIFWLKNRQPTEWRDKREIEGQMTLSLADLVSELGDDG
jgi:hypothetical protein